MKYAELLQCVGKLRHFHVDPSDPTTFVVGRLLEVFDDFILLLLISPKGRWDGFALFAIEDVVGTETERDYMQKLSALLSLHKEAEPPAIPRQHTALETIFAYAIQKNTPVALELYKSGARDVVGYVDKFQENLVYIRQIDDYGRADGVSIVRSDAISRVFCEDDELKCLTLLYASSRE